MNDSSVRFQYWVYPSVAHGGRKNTGHLSPLTHFKKYKFNTALLQLKRKKCTLFQKYIWEQKTSVIPGYLNMSSVVSLFTFQRYSRNRKKVSQILKSTLKKCYIQFLTQDFYF